MSDLTILYISASMVPEGWQRFQLDRLREAVGDSPIISVTRKPLALGLNILDTEPRRQWNIYHQMLVAARLAETPFVAMAEDDTLYTPEHFREFRPPADAVSYDRSRWSLFTWDPLFSLRQRISNCSLIAPREYLIDALEERERRWPAGVEDKYVGEVGRDVVDKRLNVTPRKMVEWFCSSPIVQLNHPTGSDTGDYGLAGGKHWVKKHAQVKAIEIPVWGKAVDLAARYY